MDLRFAFFELKIQSANPYFFLEGKAEHATNTPFLCARLNVVEALHIFNVEYLENVVNARNYFNVGALAIHDVRLRNKALLLPVAWEVEQTAVVSVLCQVGIVFACERTP